MLQCQAPPRHPNFLSHRPYQEHIYHSEGLRPQAAQALPCLASPRVQSPATGSAGLSGTISLEAIQLSTCQPGPPPRLVWSQEPGFSLLQRWPPSLCPSPALLLEECSPSPIPTSALSSPPPLRSPAEPGLAAGEGQEGVGAGRRMDTPWWGPGPVLLLPLGAGFGFDGGGAGRTEENIWEISISCPALRLPILLSPEQGRRTEEPLNGSQLAD